MSANLREASVLVRAHTSGRPNRGAFARSDAGGFAGRARTVGAGVALGLALGLAMAPQAHSEQPSEGDCPTVTGAAPRGEDTPEGKGPLDAVAVTLREGMVLGIDDLLILRQLVPRELWADRAQFFYEGMRMEVGPCHRNYPIQEFYRAATDRFAGTAKLDAKGNLSNYKAGLPFPQETIDPEADDAGMRWAWNYALRFRGAGPHGRFRIMDMASDIRTALRFEGENYELLIGGRADLPDSDYRLPQGRDLFFAAGGDFRYPFDARGLAWRQLRTLTSLRKHSLPDDVFVYVPTMRKTRRAAAPWVDGLYVPAYRLAGDSGGGGMAFGDSAAINPTAGRSIATSQNMTRGFEGLTLRPNAYRWRVVAERDVLAPLNGSAPGWPDSIDRNFGTSGLSVASDRWEVRRALLLEGVTRHRDQALKSVTYWIDRQTLQPLYRITRASGRRTLAVQIFVHRYSGDVAGYPLWPGQGKSHVFDPVAQVSFDALVGNGGWRREAYGTRSLPYPQSSIDRMVTSSGLDRGH